MSEKQWYVVGKSPGWKGVCRVATWIDVSKLGKEDVSCTVTNGEKTLEIDWLDFGVSIITARFAGGCEVVGGFNWKRDSAQQIAQAIVEAFNVQVGN